MLKSRSNWEVAEDEGVTAATGCEGANGSKLMDAEGGAVDEGVVKEGANGSLKEEEGRVCEGVPNGSNERVEGATVTAPLPFP
jgi:hypothetical protein